MPHDFHPNITAVLGPTNTGKTHLAIERMCGHSSGAIGFPLRLLAREVYDRVCNIKGAHQVGLITGEERIVPPQARWFLATMESLPMGRDLAFMGIDEAQLGADRERGHIFTDRMLHARGREETMIMGAETLRPMVSSLIPDADIITRPRFSTLSYAGTKKLSRLPPRSAIVAFSLEEVYAVAEMLRRFRGGTAVVMGALSPHTRNKQVEMFQNGEVDYLVATDAIGMGLNMDVDHIAFASLRKFDGQKQRRLRVNEIAQIAGRAGRHQRDGTFGTLAGDRSDSELTPEEIEAVEENRFPQISRLYWREADPRCSGLETLIADLEKKPSEPQLRAAPEAIDLAVLRRLSADEDIAPGIRGRKMVERFWAACSLPDFRKLGADHHARFVAQLWDYLSKDNGHLPHSFMARKVSELDNVQGDVDVLAGRIAAIRTWAYIAQRPDWLANPAEMAERTRSVEQKLSDALHNGLAQRFVDRRTTVLMRQLGKDAGLLPVTLDENNVIKVDDEPIGSLSGFEFVVDASAKLADRKILLSAAEKHLGEILTKRADELCADEAASFALAADDNGRIVVKWKGDVVAVAEKGPSLLSPRFVSDSTLKLVPDAPHDRIVKYVGSVMEVKIAKALEPLIKLETLSKDESCAPQSRALYIQLIENGGVVRRGDVQPLLNGMDPEARQAVRANGVFVGSFSVFMPHMIKPAAQDTYALLQALYTGKSVPDNSAIASFAPVIAAPEKDCATPPAYIGYQTQWVRADMAEKLIRSAHLARGDSSDAFALDEALPISMGLEQGNFHKMLRDAGFRRAEGVAADKTGEANKTGAEPERTEDHTDTKAAAKTEGSPEQPTPDADPAKADTPEDSTDKPAAKTPAEPENATPVFYWSWRGMKKRSHAPRGKRPAKGAKDKGPGAGKPRAPRPPRAAKLPDPNSPFAILGDLNLGASKSGKSGGKGKGKGKGKGPAKS